MRRLVRRGQATTEWVVLLSVLVVAVIATGWLLASTFTRDMAGLSDRAATVYASGDLGR